MITTIPFFVFQKRRPGQQLPAGKSWILAGPRCVPFERGVDQADDVCTARCGKVLNRLDTLSKC